MAEQHRLTVVARDRIGAVVVVAIGCAIADVAPFDRGFAYLTSGSELDRVCLFAAIGSAGLFFAGRCGLRLKGSGLRFPILAPVTVAVLVALYVTVLDCFVFRAMLPRGYVEQIGALPLGPRLLYFMLRTWNENIIYRLFMMSGLSWLIGFVWKTGDGRPAAGAFIAAAFLAQVINLCINVIFQLPTPVTPLTLVYDLVRFVFPGALWGYLYWRHGFATAEIASVGTHPFLQPLLGALIGRP
jgi:hypothetical protein